MAGVASPGLEGDQAVKFNILKDALYDEMQQHGSVDRLYNQKDIFDLNIIPNDDLALLLRVVHGLCGDYLLVSTENGRAGLAWRWRSSEDARKYRSLPSHETVMVYSLIDEAGGDGIWSRTLKAKLKMHESVLKQCIKNLESKGYITDMKSVEHPNKKMYIRADLRPSERATGGAWYTDNNLDEAFIAELEVVVFNFVKLKSAHLKTAPRAPKKGVVRGEPVPGPSKGRKRGATEISDDAGGPSSTNGAHAATPTPGPGPRHHHNKKDAFQPFPAGYARYPTVREIARFISDMQITNNTTLSEADVQQLVDVLSYDGLLEPVRVGKRLGYRATRIAKQDPVTRPPPRAGDDNDGVPGEPEFILGAEPPTNGLMEAPCGRCPVFELCDEGGPVSPSNCAYFQRWLGLE